MRMIDDQAAHCHVRVRAAVCVSDGTVLCCLVLCSLARAVSHAAASWRRWWQAEQPRLLKAAAIREPVLVLWRLAARAWASRCTHDRALLGTHGKALLGGHDRALPGAHDRALLAFILCFSLSLVFGFSFSGSVIKSDQWTVREPSGRVPRRGGATRTRRKVERDSKQKSDQ